MNRKILVAALAALFIIGLSGTECKAQRHVPGQHVINADFSTWKQFGGGLSWGKCGFYGNSEFGVNYATVGLPEECGFKKKIKDERKTYEAKCNDWYVSGGYLFRVASNRSRSVNLLLGGTVDAGARVYDGRYSIEVPEGEDAIMTNRVKFIYGLSPMAKFEYFPNRSVALTVHFRPRFQLYGGAFDRVFYPQFGFGCSFYIM